MDTRSFEAFQADAQAQGYDEILVREWAPGQVVGEHTHPFALHVQVVRGEVWLTEGGRTRHLQAGEHFELDHGVLHAERYGEQGATFWAARRHRS